MLEALGVVQTNDKREKHEHTNVNLEVHDLKLSGLLSHHSPSFCSGRFSC